MRPGATGRSGAGRDVRTRRAYAAPMTRPRVKIFFDGGCRPNPGAMETAVVIAGAAHIDRNAGPGSAMEAEWLALIAALRLAQTRGLTDYILVGDALAVIEQATGRVPCRGDHARHLATFQALVGAARAPRIRHVGRAQNLAGIALARGTTGALETVVINR